jgi:hypothetical protein
LKQHRLEPKQFLILLTLFGVVSIYITRKPFLKEYLVNTNTQQSFENLQPQLREDDVKASTSSNGVCDTPVTIYEGIDNCEGGGEATVDFGRNNGGQTLGSTVYSKENLSIKISKITMPVGFLSGSDIPNTNITITKDSYILPSASSMLVDRHEDVGRYPGKEKVPTVVNATWATDTSVIVEDDTRQNANTVVDTYVPSNTTACATCSTNSDKSEKIGKIVYERTLSPGHTTSEENENQIVLMCKNDTSVPIDAKGFTCIDEEYSILKKVSSAAIKVADWLQCSKVEYDDEGNLISDGKCYDTEDIVLDLSGIFENTTNAYKKAVDSNLYPGNDYNGERSIIFPAWIEIDGKGIYKISAKMNVSQLEYWRKTQEFDDVESETPSSASFQAYWKYIEGLNRNTVKF